MMEQLIQQIKVLAVEVQEEHLTITFSIAKYQTKHLQQEQQRKQPPKCKTLVLIPIKQLPV